MLHLTARKLCLLFLCLYAANCWCQVSITNQTSFHPATYGSEFGFRENTASPDSGGLITFFVHNDNASQPDSLAEVKVSWNGVYATPYQWWWPRVMAPDGWCAVQLKGLTRPFTEGDTVLIEIATTGGHVASQVYVNKSYKVRLANLIPSQDRSYMYLYIRNADSLSWSPSTFRLNGRQYTVGGVGNNLTVTALNNWQPIPAGLMAIYKIQFAAPLPELTPLLISVTGTASNGNMQTLSSFQRLVNAEFTTGTWNSSLFNSNKEEGRKLLRRLPVNSVFGPGNFTLIDSAYSEYKMSVVYEPSFDSAGEFSYATGLQNVLQRQDEQAMHYWNVDDEPDLNGKDVNQEILKNAAYWIGDTTTPSFVNLCVQKKYQRYGFFSDVVSMDHYSDDGPPNVIPFPWWYTVSGSVREALEYTDQLKFNTEPKRMVTWCQLAANTWGTDHQAEDFIINFQFWAHIAGGAKGIYYFVATPDTKEDYPMQWAEAIHSTQQLNTIKNLCLYGEPQNNVRRSDSAIIARALVSEDALVIVVLNNSIQYTPVNVFSHDWLPSISPVTYTIDIDVPAWIPIEQMYEATTNGKNSSVSITHLGGRSYRISSTINSYSQTFVIGKNDQTAPLQPTGLIWADVVSPNNLTLSWKEPFDNFGVKGYYIKSGNSIIDSTRSPIWETTGRFSACSLSDVAVSAYDDNGNQSPVATIAMPVISSTGTPVIYTQPGNDTVSSGMEAIFTVADSGATPVNYQWQADSGSGIWFNLTNSAVYSGVYTNALHVNTNPALNGYKFRCVVSPGCQQGINSGYAVLTVTQPLGIHTLSGPYFTIQPNPATDRCTIVCSETTTGYSYNIFDLSGRLVIANSITDQFTNVDISTLEPGVYMIVFNNHTGKLQSSKIIKL